MYEQIDCDEFEECEDAEDLKPIERFYRVDNRWLIKCELNAMAAVHISSYTSANTDLLLNVIGAVEKCKSQ